MALKKVFIVGAGASAEFGLPKGSDLVKKIESICTFEVDTFGRVSSGDFVFSRAVNKLCADKEPKWSSEKLIAIAEKLKQNMGLAPSIDNFLDSKRGEIGWAEVGKLAIAKAILEAERRSSLYIDTSNRFNKLNFSQFPKNWLTELFRILVMRKGKDEFREALQSCHFVVFNYDRVIEQFFLQAIRSYFDLNHADATELCSQSLNITHVYGSLGEVYGSNHYSFGSSDEPVEVLRSSKNIKTFTEGASSDSHISTARSWIDDAGVLMFLGFGYLPINLRILAPEKGKRYNKRRLIGTSKGMSPSNLEIAQNFLRHEWYGGLDYAFEFEPVEANELIWRHWMYLAEADQV
jgi:hypothetical protein